MSRSLKFFLIISAATLYILIVFFHTHGGLGPPRGSMLAEHILQFALIWILCSVFLWAVLISFMGFGLYGSSVVNEIGRTLGTGRSNTNAQSVQRPQLPPEHAFDGLYGQDHAVRVVKDTITAARRGLVTHHDGLLASFLFLGPTGVGKTELAYRVASFVQQPLAKFDMAEFVDRHASYRFTGSPPGYTGSHKPGQLAQAVIDHGPSLVLLLDEISLAHPRIWDLFMGLLDKGVFQDGSTGRWYNLQRKAIVIMTSNALEDRATDLANLSERELRDLLSTTAGWRGVAGQDFPFRQAFVGRIGRIVPFQPLSPEAIRAIIRGRLDVALTGLTQHNGLQLPSREDLIDELTIAVRGARYGVREIDSLIYERLAPLVST